MSNYDQSDQLDDQYKTNLIINYLPQSLSDNGWKFDEF